MGIVVLVKKVKKAYNQNVLKPRPNQKTNQKRRKAKEDTERLYKVCIYVHERATNYSEPYST
jgi:hypothetical protein